MTVINAQRNGAFYKYDYWFHKFDTVGRFIYVCLRHKRAHVIIKKNLVLKVTQEGKNIIVYSNAKC